MGVFDACAELQGIVILQLISSNSTIKIWPLARSMDNVLAHRGPNDSGEYIGEHVGFCSC